MKTISADCIFLYFYLILFAIKPCNGGFAIEEFFLIYRDDFPDFLKENFCMNVIMRTFSKLSEMTILIPFPVLCIFVIGNFGDSRCLVLKIIVLVQIQGIQVLKSPSTLANA